MSRLQMYSVWMTAGFAFMAYGLKDSGPDSAVRRLFRARPYLSSFLLFCAAHFFPVFILMRLNNSQK